MRKIKRGDTVIIMRGRYQDKGKKGKVLKVEDDQKVYVEGIRLVKKAVKGKGYVEKEAPVHISNVMVVCPKCGKPTRVEIQQKDGKRFRVCKKCGAPIDKV